MPASDPIWQDMSGFTAALDELDAEKEREIIQLSLTKRSGDVRNFLTDFAPELAYLECESDSLRKIADDFPELLLDDDPDEFDALVGLLQRYRAIRPQGSSRSEESTRSVERASLEEEIVDKLAGWTGELAERMERFRLLLESERERNDSPAPEESPSAEESGLAKLRENLRAEKSKSAELKARYDEQGGKLRELKKTLKKETKAKEALAGEVAQLRERMEKLELNSEKGTVNGAGENRDECLVRYPPAHLENVKDAVSQASRTFSDELHLALNAKSQDNSAFQKPEEVFAALSWLAGDYRDQMMNPEPGMDFNGKLREVCPNWFYTPRQSPTARGKYPEWYATTVNGASFELHEHIGRGKSHDAKSNIRIAFAWNEQENKVVVGYIGRHQKTDLA